MKVDRRSVGETRAAPGERSPTRSSCQRPTEWPAARADQDPSRSCRSSSNRNQREEETAVRRGWPSGELPLGIAAEGDSAQILTWCPSSRGANDHLRDSDRILHRNPPRQPTPCRTARSDDASRDHCAPIAMLRYTTLPQFLPCILQLPSVEIQGARLSHRQNGPDHHQ